MPPPVLQAPGPAPARPAPPGAVIPGTVVPCIPPQAPAPAPIACAGLPQPLVDRLMRSLNRYLTTPPLPLPPVTYPYCITLVDIDPDTIAGRVVIAGA